jgi:hypothetical protein
LALGTGLETAAETWNGASKIDDKNWIKEQFISSQAFHRTPSGRVRETTAGERLELGNLELFDQELQNNTRTRTCKKPHLKLRKIPTRIESFKELKTQFGDTASLAHCEDRRPDQQISVPSRTEESQPKLIELVSSTRKRKT